MLTPNASSTLPICALVTPLAHIVWTHLPHSSLSNINNHTLAVVTWHFALPAVATPHWLCAT